MVAGAAAATDRHHVIPPMDTVPDTDSTPLEVRWRDIADFDELDERVSAITVLFGSVIGVNEGYVEWSTYFPPAEETERLAWLWLCWPQLDEQLMSGARPDHRELMRAYRAGKMQEWWEEIGRSAAG